MMRVRSSLSVMSARIASIFLSEALPCVDFLHRAFAWRHPEDEGMGLSSSQKEMENMSKQESYRIIVGYDFSLLASRAAREAFELATQHKYGEVHVVSVEPQMVDFIGAQATTGMSVPVMVENNHHAKLSHKVQEMMDEWCEETSKSFSLLKVHSRTNQPAEGILELAEEINANLIVMGTHGRKGLKRFLYGSVAEDVVRNAPCPVMVIPLEMANENVPQIEPPCPECVAERFRTRGEEMWCARHREHHIHGQAHHYSSRVGRPSSRPLMM